MHWREKPATYMTEYAYGWTNPETDYDAKILGQADRSIALARDNMYAYTAKSQYLTISLRPNDGLRVANSALVINPNFAFSTGRGAGRNVLAPIRTSKVRCGTSDAAKSARSENGPFHNWLADAELGLGNFDAAIDEANKAIDAIIVVGILT